MLAVLIILGVVLVLVMAGSFFGVGPGPTRRRTTVVRPVRRRRVVEEVVDDDPPVTRRIVE
jgi:hypothetical protein